MNVFEKIQQRLREKYNDYSKVRVDYAEGLRDGYIGAMTIISEVEAEFEKDVCEWRWGIDRAMVQCKGDYIIFESRRLFSFCPYCGKKIKVVE